MRVGPVELIEHPAHFALTLLEGGGQAIEQQFLRKAEEWARRLPPGEWIMETGTNQQGRPFARLWKPGRAPDEVKRRAYGYTSTTSGGWDFSWSTWTN